MNVIDKINIAGIDLNVYKGSDNMKYFLAGEIGEMLGYSKSNVSKMVSKIDSNKKIKELIISAKKTNCKARMTQCRWFLTEEGMAELTLNSKKITTKLKEEILRNLNIDYAITYSRKEIEFIDTLEKILEPFGYEGIKQYKVLNYKVDFYIKDLNIAIEFDEKGHTYYPDECEKDRQLNIEKEIKCEFVRVSEKDSDLWNCGYVLKHILEIGGKYGIEK